LDGAVLTGVSVSLLAHPSEFIESLNVAEAMTGRCSGAIADKEGEGCDVVRQRWWSF